MSQCSPSRSMTFTPGKKRKPALYHFCSLGHSLNNAKISCQWTYPKEFAGENRHLRTFISYNWQLTRNFLKNLLYPVTVNLLLLILLLKVFHKFKFIYFKFKAVSTLFVQVRVGKIYHIVLMKWWSTDFCKRITLVFIYSPVNVVNKKAKSIKRVNRFIWNLLHSL